MSDTIIIIMQVRGRIRTPSVLALINPIPNIIRSEYTGLLHVEIRWYTPPFFLFCFLCLIYTYMVCYSIMHRFLTKSREWMYVCMYVHPKTPPAPSKRAPCWSIYLSLVLRFSTILQDRRQRPWYDIPPIERILAQIQQQKQNDLWRDTRRWERIHILLPPPDIPSGTHQ